MRRLLLLLSLLIASPAFAQVEQLEQIEPEKGVFQVELFSGPGGQVIEGLAGITDTLALGGEIEFEDGRFDAGDVTALLRLTDPERDAVGLAVEGQIGFGGGGTLREIELRAMIERRGSRWWLQADPILRQTREDGARDTAIAYAVSAQRRLLGVWLGVEASGRIARIAGEAGDRGGRHYIGPSVTLETAGDKAEIGLAWMQRVAGAGNRSGPKAFVQIDF